MMLKNLVFFATLAVMLTACADLAWQTRAPSPQAPAARDDAPATAGRPPPAAKAKAAELNAIRPEPRPAEAAAEILSPPRLVGLSEDETADLLGRPAEEEAAPPGKIWIYRAAGCRLSVHLFPDMEQGGFYTLDYTTAEGARETCLGKVASEARRERAAAR